MGGLYENLHQRKLPAIQYIAYMSFLSRTTVCMAPGFCSLRALTVWNTSTTLSHLQESMQLSRAQNTAHLPTVLLWVEQVWTKHQYRITTRTHLFTDSVRILGDVQ